MKTFLDENFLLSCEKSVELWNSVKDIPIIDYHCHINPKEIYEDYHASNITELWLYADHYKWRAMRSCGVDEKYITGDASDYEKFAKFAEIMPMLAGNPMYHWSHLELKRYFGFDKPLNSDTCEECWKHTSDILAKGLGVREIIEKSNVRIICTTDDPTDTLEYHRLLSEDKNLKVKVFPAFRPDKAMKCDKEGYRTYIENLAKASGTKINSFDSLCEALKKRLDFFESMHCLTADHGLDTKVPFKKAPNKKTLDDIFAKCSSTDKPSPTEDEISIFQTELLRFFAKEYRERKWVMQIHFGVLRNSNAKYYKLLGPDSGFDIMNSDTGISNLASLLSEFVNDGGIPRTILYSINPNDNEAVATLCGAFQNSDDNMPRCLQGSAWWFCDNESGMRNQLTSLANLSALGKFPGMLTDSRSFLSYTRHEYFRRILCDLVGSWVDSGRLPDCKDTDDLVKNICYKNTYDYFNFERYN